MQKKITSIGIIAGIFLAVYITVDNYLLPALPDFGFTWLLVATITSVLVYLSHNMWWGKLSATSSASKIWLAILVIGTCVCGWIAWNFVPGLATGIKQIWQFFVDQKALGLVILFGILAYNLYHYGKEIPKLHTIMFRVALGFMVACLLVYIWEKTNGNKLTPQEIKNILFINGLWIGWGLLLVVVFILACFKKARWIAVCLFGLGMLLTVADCSNRQVHAEVRAGLQPRAPVQPVIHKVTVTSDAWTPIAWDNTTLGKYREFDSPRAGKLLSLTQNKPPTERDLRLATVIPIGGLRPPMPTNNGEIVWMRAIPTEDGTPVEFEVRYWYANW